MSEFSFPFGKLVSIIKSYESIGEIMANNKDISNDRSKRKDVVNESQIRATVCEIDGKLVLDDPDALAVITAMGKSNCKGTLDLNLERVAHFINRVTELGHTANDVVIVIINVDDKKGTKLAEALMPRHDWQQYRDKGEIPFARGLAVKSGVQVYLGVIDEAAATKLESMKDLAVVVIDYGVAEVYPAVKE